MSLLFLMHARDFIVDEKLAKRLIIWPLKSTNNLVDSLLIFITYPQSRVARTSIASLFAPCAALPSLQAQRKYNLKSNFLCVTYACLHITCRERCESDYGGRAHELTTHHKKSLPPRCPAYHTCNVLVALSYSNSLP
jgi:hypothetical protein